MELLFAVHSKADQSAQEVRCDVKEWVVFGRTPESPIPIDGPGVSREHFYIKVDAEKVLLTDHSANGTWLNGDRIAKGREYPVQATDLIEVPGYEIRVQPPEPAPVVKAPAGGTQVAPLEQGVTPAPLLAEVVAEPEPKKSPLAFVGNIVNSFTGLEKFIIVVDVACITLLAWYFGS